MRRTLALLVALAGTGGLLAGQEPKADAPARRFDIDADLKTYPQGTAKEAFASVLQAVEDKRIDYLVAHLADPEWVDRRVQFNGGGFDLLVKETTAKLLDDPAAVKQLKQFFADGEWDVRAGTATVRLKDVADRCVYFRLAEGRWFLENRMKAEPPPKKKVVPIDKP